LVETLEKLGEKIHIDTLVSDASEAIRNAFLLVFSAGKLIIMCWAHVRRNVVKHLHLVDEDYKDEIMVDIDALQLASNNENFDKAKDLFIKKWNSKKQNEFINYMKSMWLSSHQNWYEGVAFNTPSHNNGLD
jgi:transposase-like protein